MNGKLKYEKADFLSFHLKKILKDTKHKRKSNVPKEPAVFYNKALKEMCSFVLSYYSNSCI